MDLFFSVGSVIGGGIVLVWLVVLMVGFMKMVLERRNE
jgi:hypothetical protein